MSTAERNAAIYRMVVIEGKSLAVPAAAFNISRNRAMQIACKVAGTRTLTDARESVRELVKAWELYIASR